MGWAPQWRPGDVVIWDNLQGHQAAYRSEAVPAMRERPKAKGLFLPPYSPDCNPIEPCWSKRKEHLRAAKARTEKGLQQARKEAVQAVTARDAQGWFTHCGYQLQ